MYANCFEEKRHKEENEKFFRNMREQEDASCKYRQVAGMCNQKCPKCGTKTCRRNQNAMLRATYN